MGGPRLFRTCGLYRFADIQFPIGLLAFGDALDALVHCITSPAGALAGDWLLGLSWLANPAAWAGMVFCWWAERGAALSGELALLLAALRFFARLCFASTSGWRAWSMSCTRHLRSQRRVGRRQCGCMARPPLPKRTPDLLPAVALPVVFGASASAVRPAGPHQDHAPPSRIRPERLRPYRGGRQLRYPRLGRTYGPPGADKPVMPASASNFWLTKTVGYLMAYLLDVRLRQPGGVSEGRRKPRRSSTKRALTVATIALCGDHGRSGILFKKRGAEQEAPRQPLGCSWDQERVGLRKGHPR